MFANPDIDRQVHSRKTTCILNTFFSKGSAQYVNISYVKSVNTEHLKQQAWYYNVPESELNVEG